MIYVFFWLCQDFLTVLTAGAMRTPEIFLLYLTYRLLTADQDVRIFIIWTAFAGGLLWDLRWIGIPGIFTLSYVGTVMIVLWVWSILPASGRAPFLIFSMFWGTQLLPTILSILVLESNSGYADWPLFWVQQGCAAPLALLSAFLYCQQEKIRDA
jgi:rod shape-determining protein MreD